MQWHGSIFSVSKFGNIKAFLLVYFFAKKKIKNGTIDFNLES